MRITFLSIFASLSLLAGGQSTNSTPSNRESIEVTIGPEAQFFTVRHSIQSQHSNQLRLEWDVPAWSSNESVLYDELIHEQKEDIHFASAAERGSASTIGAIINGKEDSLTLGLHQLATDQNQIELFYAFSPPNWDLANSGRSATTFAMNRPLVRTYWGEQADYSYPANYYGYSVNYPSSKELVINNPKQLSLVVPGKSGVQKSTVVRSQFSSSDPTFYAAQNLFQYVQETASDTVYWIYESEIPPIPFEGIIKRLKQYIKHNYGADLPSSINILILKDKGKIRSFAPGVLVIEYNTNPVNIELDILEAYIEQIHFNQLKVNMYNDPWLIDGFAHYHRYNYQSRYYPEAKLFGSYANSLAARFLDVDELSPSYLHHWLYLFMARQGLDQPLSDSAIGYAPFNRQAIVKGKASLLIGTLRGYAGERSFVRGMQRINELSTSPDFTLTPQTFTSSIQYYSNSNLDWFLGDVYSTNGSIDYSLLDLDQCSYIVTARVENRGEVAIPYPTVGYDRNGEPVMEEWHEGHLGIDTVQLHLEDYSAVTIDPNQQLPDLNGRNQRRQPDGIFQQFEPLRLGLYTGLDQPNKTQIYWMPSAKFNAYDGILAGVSFYNKTIMPKRWEYKIGPEYSTRTGQLTGSASLRYYRPYSTGWLHALEIGVYGRYFHYDEGLGYARISPGVNFHFRKNHPRSTVQQTLKVRGVGVNRELREADRELDKHVTNANYWITDVKYIREQQHILHPSLFIADFQLSDRFAKLGLTYRQRWMLPNKQWLGVRGFVGSFLFNNQPAGQPFFSFGLSGTQDYLYDYSFIGRSDSSGVWSQQFFISDGGFKSATGIYSSTWMTSLAVNVPIWKGLGVFGDIGYSGLQEIMYWDYGIRLAIVPDFLEFYFPIQSSLQTQVTGPNYAAQVRFVLNLNQTDIVQRLRRGWY